MDRIIRVDVNGTYVRADAKNAGVQGESDAASLHIFFNEEWRDYGRWIIWHNALGEDEKTLFLTPEAGDPLTCVTPIPGEALAEAGWCCFRIEGGSSEVSAVTDTVRLYVKPREGAAGASSGGGGEGCGCDLTDIRAQIGANTARISVTASEIRSEVSDSVAGLTSSISQTAAEIRSEVEDHVNDLRSEISQTADAVTAQVTDNAGQLGQLQLTAGQLQTRLENAEGNMSTLSQSAAAAVSRIEAAEGEISQLEQTVEGFTFSVSEPAYDGKGGAQVRLTIGLGGNTYSGVVKVDGNMQVTGAVAAQSLYAFCGDVARLTVDSLSTSRRIPMYLAGDTSDDNYIFIKDQRISFRTAANAGGTEQARDPDGKALYWEKDISAASLGSDGYPCLEGERVFTTTKPTSWPVRVYTYTEQTKLSWDFDENGLHEPRMVYGAGWEGAASDQGKGFFQKRNDCFDIWFAGHNGETGLSMGDYLDLAGQRKATNLNFSGWNAGTFSETLDGGVWHSFSVQFDGQGRPVKITDAGGHETTVTW